MSAVFDELTWRGLVANSTDEAALIEHLEAGPVTFYVGFDPTAPSLHMGNLVQLMVVRAMQRAGHRPLILVGGSTGLIGDPKATGERVLNSKETVAGWVARIQQQVERLVDFSGPTAAQVVNNLDWTQSLSVLDFLRDIGKHFPVNRMLAREVVKARLEDGISYTEFSYVLLQSLDYLELNRTYGCTLQFGGSDQWGNITAGVELIRRSDGVHVHALATPLLTKADGTKFGKTESGTVWLDPAMTTPYAFHQFFLNAEDTKVIEYLKVFSERPRDEIDELERQTVEAPHRRAAQRALADDITALVHSPTERDAAVAAAAALFGRSDLAAADRADGGQRRPGAPSAGTPGGSRASARGGCVGGEWGGGQQVGGASGDRRGWGLPQQRPARRPRRSSRRGRPAARPVRHHPPRQADGRSRLSRARIEG